MSAHPAPATRPKPTVLVVDDEPGIRAALEANFLREGWQPRTAANLRDAELRLAQEDFDLLLSDVRLPDGSGTELLPGARAGNTPLVLMTAFASVPDAVEAIQCGAGDYLTKPVAWSQLRAVAGRLVAERQAGAGRASGLTSPAATLPQPRPAARESTGAPGGIVGRAPALRLALERARAAAATDADVLIQAESGTGKELLARFIHDASSRAAKPFVAINCAAVPEHLLESELFGHARGAFTGATHSRPGKFELAQGGTLLLDEIGDMPLHLQPKLLRVLQEREFERLGEGRTIRADIRVVATTNVHLPDAVNRGLFRSDLFYRLNVIPLTLPPLHERPEDIALLATHFCTEWAAREGRAVPVLTPEFLSLLTTHPWPGNIRELANFLRRVFSLNAHRSAPLGAEAFLAEAAPQQPPAPAPASAAPPSPNPVPAGLPIRELERMHLEKTLALTHGNRTHAAEMLGISLRTMRNKIREYGLPPRQYA
jgi:DNA-binding NtrC family response regulator